MANSKKPPEGPGTRFGERLKELRAAAGLTQAQLAARACEILSSSEPMHVNVIKNLEQGLASQGPRWGTVLVLAQALGVEITAFLPTDHTKPTTDPAVMLAAQKLAAAAVKAARKSN